MASSVLTFHDTTIGKKAVVAVTGFVLFMFLIGHLLGNLQIFIGPAAVNEYAASLRRVPALLWTARLVLLASVVLHIWFTLALAGRNADARPVAYQRPRKHQVTTYAARTMVWSGPIIGLYIVYHLLHLTFGYAPGYEHDHQNVYNNLVYSFQQPMISAVYVVANVLMGMHLFHGAWSWLQSLGMNHVRYNIYRKRFAVGLAALIAGGNVLIPVSVMAGWVEPTEERFCYEELAVREGECEGFEER